MKVSHVFVSAALLVSGVAFAQGGQAMTQPAPEAKRQAGMQHEAGMKMGDSMMKLMPKDEQQFAQTLHHANQLEIRLGQLAQQKGQSDQVKEFGKRMVDDHTKADEQLMTLAKTNKWNLNKEPKAANDVQRKMKDAEKATEAKLKALDGAAFDAEYMSHMVADHNMDLAKVSHAAQMFKGSELANQLNQLQPVLTQHRDHALRVLGQLKPEQQMGVGGAGEQPMPMEMPQMDPGMNTETDSEMKDDSGKQME